MKYTVLTLAGLLSMILGYGLVKSAREYRVTCVRTESAFLPVCRVREYILGLPNASQTVGEIKQLANYGKETRQFFLLQRLGENKAAPINLNKVRADHPADREPVASLNHLASFFGANGGDRVDVRLANEAGSVPWGLLFLAMGAVLVFVSRRFR